MIRYTCGARAAATVMLSALLLSACSDGDEPAARATTSTVAPSSTAPTTTPSTTTSEPGDGAPTTAPGEGSGAASELDGTAWVLTQIVRGGATTEVPQAPVPAVVTFRGGAVDVYDGVNTASGSYQPGEGDAVDIEMGQASTFPYTGERLPQYDLIQLLPEVQSARRDGDRLVLSLDGDSQLVLAPAAGGTTQ